MSHLDSHAPYSMIAGSRRPRRVRSLLAIAALLCATAASAHVYQFDNTTGAAIPTVAGGTGTTVYTSTGGTAAIANNAYAGGGPPAGSPPAIAGMTCKTISVASETGSDTIEGPVSVTIPIDHFYLGNLVIKLFTPAEDFTLVSRPGTSEPDDTGAGGGDGDSSNLESTDPITFAMGGTDAETMGSGLDTDGEACQDNGICTYSPNNGASTLSEDLSLLNGDSKVGDWTLCIGDAVNSSGFDVGSFEDWTLDLGSVSSPADEDCDDGTSSLEVEFEVFDSFTATTIAVGINASHNERGDLRARLAAPDGTIYALVTQNGDTDNNYDILVTSNDDTGEPGTGPLDDGSVDPTAEPFFNRIVTGVTDLGGVSEAANGFWTLRICDRDDNGVTGTLNRARLVLLDSTAAARVCSSRVEYEWGDNGNDATFNSAERGGVTISQAPGDRVNYSGSFGDNHVTITGTSNGETGYYSLFMDADSVGGTTDDPYEAQGQLARFNFSEEVQDLEFSLFDTDQAPDDFEDVMRVEGESSLATGLRRYQRSIGTAHEIAGDMIEGDDSIGGTEGTSTYLFDRSVDTLLVYYFEGGDRAPTDANDQFTGISDLLFCAYDYGDAPGTYGTLLSGGARHVLGTRDLWIGANPPDGEADGQTGGGAATADDITDVSGTSTPDDEDGVSLFPACPNDGTYTVSVTASNFSGSAATLVGYLDWGRDGAFNTSEERSASVNVPNGTSDGVFNVTWTSVPANCGGTTSTFARFRISTDSASVLSPTGQAPDGEIEDYQLGSGTLPVTLAWVDTSNERGGLAVRWATVSESSNAGFRVWGLDAEGGRTLLGRVPSKGADSFAPQRYEARFPASAGSIVEIEIEDVALTGGNRLHGPFAIGQAAGSEPDEGARIDWRAIKAEWGIAGPLDSFRTVGEPGGIAPAFEAKGRKRPGGPSGGAGLARLLVRETGIHRVTYEQLLAAGIDLTGVAETQIALLDGGAGVARHVEMPAATFGPGAYVEFVARPQLTLASPVDVYVLALDPARAVAAKTIAARPVGLGVTEAELVVRPDRAYSYSASNGDPWYDQRALAWGGPATISRTFDLPDLVAGPVELDLLAWGYVDWQGAAPDHHVRISINGTEVVDEHFDGFTPFERTVDVTDLVGASGNLLELHLPRDTGYDFDHVALEGFVVRFARETVALDGSFEGSVATPFQIGGFVDGEPVSVWQLVGGAAMRSQPTPVGGLAIAPGGGRIYAAQGAAIRTPGIQAGVPAAKTASTAEYLVVAHPAFVDGASALTALRQSQGLSTEVVTVDAIYAAYSDHAASPEAIRRFFEASWNQGNLRYALLVGGDTVDPYDHLGIGSVSYVPSFYLPYAAYPIFFSGTDERMVDFDGDAVGEVPIGRLPVRTPAELEALVTKIGQWEANVASGSFGALLAAGASDTARVVANLNEAYALSLAAWSPLLAQVDDLGTAEVRAAVLEALGTGTPLVSYVGHSSAPRWDFTPILQWQDVAGLDNFGAPSLVTQWGCWNSYYMDPAFESLSAHLLRKVDGGAAGTIGAMTLTTDSAHRTLGSLFYARVGAGAATVGDAFRGAKLDLAAQGWGEDALLGMALLGDPAMSLPAAVPEKGRR